MWRDGHHILLTSSYLLCFRGRIQRKKWCMGPYVEDDYNYNLPFPLCLLQSRLQHTYHGKPYARVDRNSLPKSTFLFPSQELWIWPQIGSVLKACDWRICRSKKVVNSFANKALSLERKPSCMGLKLLPKFYKFTSYLCIIQYNGSITNVYICNATVLCSEFKY